MTINKFNNYATKETVKTLTVEDFVKKYKIQRIDLLQIDCEGYDFEILEDFWELEFRPRVLKVEKVYFTEEQFKKIYDMLSNAGYEHQIVGDDIVAYMK